MTREVKNVTVTFVCTGNTCRSPMGEAILKSLSESWGWEMRVFSAGLFATPGAPMSANAEEVLRQVFRIPDFHHSAMPMTAELFTLSDLVIPMTGGHARLLAERFGKSDKIVPMPVEVGDPWGGDLDQYETCAREIVRGICLLKEKGILHG